MQWNKDKNEEKCDEAEWDTRTNKDGEWAPAWYCVSVCWEHSTLLPGAESMLQSSQV